MPIHTMLLGSITSISDMRRALVPLLYLPFGGDSSAKSRCPSMWMYPTFTRGFASAAARQNPRHDGYPT